jgi:hypothetical protein
MANSAKQPVQSAHAHCARGSFLNASFEKQVAKAGHGRHHARNAGKAGRYTAKQNTREREVVYQVGPLSPVDSREAYHGAHCVPGSEASAAKRESDAAETFFAQLCPILFIGSGEYRFESIRANSFRQSKTEVTQIPRSVRHEQYTRPRGRAIVGCRDYG